MSLVSRLLSTQCHVQSSKSMKRPRDSWSFLSEISILIENSSVRFTSFISHKISYIHRNHLMHFLALCNMFIKFLSRPQIHHLVNDLHCRQTSSSKGWPNPTSKCMIKEIFNKKDYRPPCKKNVKLNSAAYALYKYIVGRSISMILKSKLKIK